MLVQRSVAQIQMMKSKRLILVFLQSMRERESILLCTVQINLLIRLRKIQAIGEFQTHLYFSGFDELNNVERIKFSDGTLALDIDPGDTAGQAYRLYQAAFARVPDMPGVAYHMNDMESNGLVLWNIANNFLASPEFKSKYGENPTDEEYVNLLYQNVLGRSADPVAE